jgi:hypothetical protein
MWSCGVNLERLGFMDCNGCSWLGRCAFDIIYSVHQFSFSFISHEKRFCFVL